jgi:hypothetical protein
MESGSLNLPEPSGPHRPVMGLLYLLHIFTIHKTILFSIALSIDWTPTG